METATAPTPSAPSASIVSTETFEVLLRNRDGVEAGLLALQKRAQKKGLPPLSWSWGKVSIEEEIVPSSDGVGVQRNRKVARVPLTLAGGSLALSGWDFVAVLQHLDGENIVRAVGSAEVPAMYRTRGPVCDHCRQNRRRSDTYVVRHEDGRYAQVGSTCLDDFLGSDLALKLAALAELFACARDLGQGGESGLGFGGGHSSSFVLQQYLPLVAWVVRTCGWVSRTVAKEQGSVATADRALRLMDDEDERRKYDAEPSEEDLALAAAAEKWADTLTDAQVDAERGDYLHNLRAVARTGLGTNRTAGIAASMVTAYQRHVANERLRAERAKLPCADTHVGTVGKRETFLATLEFVTGYESAYGYTTVLKFRTEEGALLVWKASSTTLGRADAGKKYAVVGTVKKHDEYKGSKQTLLTRCKVTERMVKSANKESA